MNKRNQKMLALMAAVLSVAAMMAGCGQKAAQESQVTVPVTEVPETAAPEETTLPVEMEAVVTVPEVEAPEAGSITYVEYLELTAEEQQVYYENFETPDAFFAWMDSAKAEYEASTEPLETFADENQEVVNDGFFEEESVEDW